MEKFAQVFEFHGRQILVKKGKDSEDNPKFCVITQIEGNEIDFGPSFGDEEQGWKALEGLFSPEGERTLQECAENFAGMLKDCKTIEDAILVFHEEGE